MYDVLNATGPTWGRMYIPYTSLSSSPLTLVLFGGVRVHLDLQESGGRTCRVTLAPSHVFKHGPSVSVPVGTSFELEYNGVVSEIQLGRWVLMRDATPTRGGGT